MKKLTKLTEEQKQLVESHINLVYSLANKYTRLNKSKMLIKGITNDDLVQEGFEQLCKSAIKYDESKAKFSTYAYKWINWGILNLVENYNIVKIPPKRDWDSPINRDNITTMHSIASFGVGSLNLPTIQEGCEGETIDFILDESDHYEETELFAQLGGCLYDNEMILVKRLYEDKTQSEIGSLMGVSQGTAMNRIKELRAKIMELIEVGKIMV